MGSGEHDGCEEGEIGVQRKLEIRHASHRLINCNKLRHKLAQELSRRIEVSQTVIALLPAEERLAPDYRLYFTYSFHLKTELFIFEVIDQEIFQLHSVVLLA